MGSCVVATSRRLISSAKTQSRRAPPSQMLALNGTGGVTFGFELSKPPRTVDVLRNLGTNPVLSGPAPVTLIKFALSSGAYYGRFTDAQTPTGTFFGYMLQHPAQNRGNGYVLEVGGLGSVPLTPSP